MYVTSVCIILVSVFHREQKQKEATKTAVVNSFPKDRDYRREAMQATAAPGFTAASKCYNTYCTHWSAVTVHKEQRVYMMSFLAWLAQNIKCNPSFSSSFYKSN